MAKCSLSLIGMRKREALKHSKVVAAACNLRGDADAIVAAFKEVCTNY